MSRKALAEKIKLKLEGVGIYSEIATDARWRSTDEDDENGRAAAAYFEKRNDAMREIHRLLDELADAHYFTPGTTVKTVIDEPDWISNIGGSSRYTVIKTGAVPVDEIWLVQEDRIIGKVVGIGFADQQEPGGY